MPIVALPDGREVDFPEGISEADITSVLQRDFPEHFEGRRTELARETTGAASSLEDLAAKNLQRQQAIESSNLPIQPVLSDSFSGPSIGQRLRESSFGRAMLGPTELEREAMSTGGLAGPPGGDVGVVPALMSTPAPMLAVSPTLMASKAGQVGGAAMTAYFTKEFAETAPDQVREIKQKIQEGDYEEAARLSALGLAQAGMILEGARGTGKSLYESRTLNLEPPARRAGRMLESGVEQAELVEPESGALAALDPNISARMTTLPPKPTPEQQIQTKAVTENVRVGNTETAKALAEGEKGQNALQEQVATKGVLRQERPEVGLQKVDEGVVQGQPAAEAAPKEAVAPSAKPRDEFVKWEVMQGEGGDWYVTNGKKSLRATGGKSQADKTAKAMNKQRMAVADTGQLYVPEEISPLKEQGTATSINQTAADVKKAFDGLSSGARDAFREQMLDKLSRGEEVRFTKPHAIELARKDPSLKLRDNPDGSVTVLEINDTVGDLAKLWPEITTKEIESAIGDVWPDALRKKFENLPPERQKQIDEWFTKNESEIVKQQAKADYNKALSRLANSGDDFGGELAYQLERVGRKAYGDVTANQLFLDAAKIAKDAGLDAQQIKSQMAKEFRRVYGNDAPEMLEYYFGKPSKEQGTAPGQPETVRDVPKPGSQLKTGEQIAPVSPVSSVTPDVTSGNPQEIVGMGGAIPSEFETPPNSPTSIKNAQVDRERAARGLPAAIEPIRRAWGEVWDRAMTQIDAQPEIQDALISELKAKPRALTDVEDAMLLQRQVDLQNLHGKLSRDLVNEQEWAKDYPNRLEIAEAMKVELQRVSNELLELYNINKSVGTETGRGLAARKMMALEDFTLAKMELDARLDKGGKELTEAERSEIARLQKRIEETEKAFEDYKNRVAEDVGIHGVEEVIKETRQRVKRAKTGASVEEIAAGIKNAATDEAPLDVVSDYIRKLEEALYRQGITQREPMIDAVHKILVDNFDPTITRRETMDAMSGYGKFKPLNPDAVKAGLRDLHGQMQQVAKLEDIQAREPLKKTGLERRTPSDEERRLIQQVNEAKRRFGVVVTDPAKQLKSALDATKTRLKHQIADLDYQIQTRQKIVKTKTPGPKDTEVESLIAQRDSLRKQFDEIFPKQPLTDTQRAEIARRALEKSIAEYEQRIANKDIAGKPRKAPVSTPQLEALRTRRDALKAELNELRTSDEGWQLAALKSRLLQNTARYQERLAAGDFAPRRRAEPKMDAEALKLKAENEIAKGKWQEARARWQYENLSKGRKIWEGSKEILNLPRSIWTSYDVSAPLRQGGFIGLGNPSRAIKGIIPMFRALASERAAHVVDQEIQNRPNAPLYKQSKLYLAPLEGGSKLSAMEEQWMSRLVGKIPGVRASGRSFVTFLNKLRADSFDAMVNNFKSQWGDLTQPELEAIANYINVATGRGNLYQLSQGAETMATVFFAPRLVASRFQLLAGQPLYHGSNRTRALVAKEYGKFMTGVSVVIGLGLLAGATVENDPKSTDFGKLRFGDTRVDLLGGLAQPIVLTERLISGKTKNTKGQIMPLRGDDVPYGASNWRDTLWNFTQSKFSPSISLAMELGSGETLVGEKVTPAQVGAKVFMPLSYRDIYEAIQDQGIPKGTAMGVLSLFGAGLQTYHKGDAAEIVGLKEVERNLEGAEVTKQQRAKIKEDYINTLRSEMKTNIALKAAVQMEAASIIAQENYARTNKSAMEVK